MRACTSSIRYIDKDTVTTPKSPRYFAGLDGLRLFSAYGVVFTHTAFQTAHVHDTLIDRFLGRLDLAVAVFFALSGFLLWKPRAQQAYKHTVSPISQRLRSECTYYLHRFVRIVPAYLLVVLVAFAVLPQLHRSSAAVIWANLSFTQIYFPYTLVDGLTQMWSMDVEISFYIALPIIAWMTARIFRPRIRVFLLGLTSVLSLLWWLLPGLNHYDGVDFHSALPGYWCWFAMGMLIAEIYPRYLALSSRLSSLFTWHTRTLPTYTLSALIYGIAMSPWGGAPGLFTPSIHERLVRLLCGATIAYLLIAKQVINPGSPHSIFSLSHPVFSSMGRWGYGIFLWHLCVLITMMSLIGVFPFQGHFLILASSTLLFSTIAGAISYICVEAPLMRWVKRLQL